MSRTLFLCLLLPLLLLYVHIIWQSEERKPIWEIGIFFVVGKWQCSHWAQYNEFGWWNGTCEKKKIICNCVNIYLFVYLFVILLRSIKTNKKCFNFMVNWTVLSVVLNWIIVQISWQMTIGNVRFLFVRIFSLRIIC